VGIGRAQHSRNERFDDAIAEPSQHGCLSQTDGF
jgi:hypothetical protein